MSDFDTTYARHKELRAKANEINKAVLFDVLAFTSITSIHVDFDGEGDSGQINGVVAFRGDDPATLPNTSRTSATTTSNKRMPAGKTTMAGMVNSASTLPNAASSLSSTGVSQTPGPTTTHFRGGTMAHPYHHALSSVKKWGGILDDYIRIHDWFDESKMIIADFRHRALRHHAEGIFMAETIFGSTITLSTGRVIPVRWIGEQHVREDLGFIPSFADWVKAIRPEPWMGRAQRLEETLNAEEVAASR